MPKVKCFEISGLYCWFWSNDHDPPHFHAKRNGEWELTVKFLEGKGSMFEIKWGKPRRPRFYGRSRPTLSLTETPCCLSGKI